MRRKESEPLQWMTSAVHTSMKYQCEGWLWKLPDEEKERLLRENGNDLEYVGLLRKSMNGWQVRDAQMLVGKHNTRRS